VLGNIREVNCVGLPTLDLGDCINLNSAAYKITEKMSLYRIDTKFDGAFDIKMTFKRGLMSHVLN
jgi:hypothetical protein